MSLVNKFIRLSVFEKAFTLSTLWSLALTQIAFKGFFGQIGRGSYIKHPHQIVGPSRITIGHHTHIEKDVTLFAIGTYANVVHDAHIEIGDHVYLNRSFNASSARRIVIGNNVTCGSNVSLFDYDHGWQNIHLDVNTAPLIVHGEIQIGSQTWLGNNVTVVGNVKIGSRCVVGAGSVVTKDIPDYTVAVGTPARLIKQYKHETGSWVKLPARVQD